VLSIAVLVLNLAWETCRIEHEHEPKTSQKKAFKGQCGAVQLGRPPFGKPTVCRRIRHLAGGIDNANLGRL
ncbi:MAG: hypothetical protein MI861_22935, partial [Pirellulales bacterium]|nr:hypothetical protein [Pirellulales bacterium]